MEQSINSRFHILISDRYAKLSMLVILGIIISIITLLLNQGKAQFYVSVPFYITILFIFASLMKFGPYGLIVGFVSFLINGFLLKLSADLLSINIFINVLQSLLIYFGIWILLNSKRKNRNKYCEGVFYISGYNFVMILCTIAYFLLHIIMRNEWLRSIVMLLFTGVIMVFTIGKIIQQRDLYLLGYTLIIALLPSLICSTISALLSKVPADEMFVYISTWACSNFILIQSMGYIIFQLMFKKAKENRFKMYTHNVEINDSTIIYFMATLIWNALIIYLFVTNVFDNQLFVYFFPWLFGNVLFGGNLFFSLDKTKEHVKGELFDWYENRVIVIEKNTNTLITIIAFLLPLSSFWLKEISPKLLYLFVANIFCASMAIGLIWIPSTNIKFIAFLKSLKTMFYLFSIALLLITSTMIVFSGMA